MIELTEDNVYRVKNFAKHKNIKVKEKIKSKDEAEVVKIDDIGNLESTSSSINKVDNMSKGKTNNKFVLMIMMRKGLLVKVRL